MEYIISHCGLTEFENDVTSFFSYGSLFYIPGPEKKKKVNQVALPVQLQKLHWQCNFE
jgi:hypothetical protein